jgi:hypothetical protein
MEKGGSRQTQRQRRGFLPPQNTEQAGRMLPTRPGLEGIRNLPLQISEKSGNYRTAILAMAPISVDSSRVLSRDSG